MNDLFPYTWIMQYFEMFRHIIDPVSTSKFQAYQEGKGAADGKGETHILMFRPSTHVK